jgi:K(+)-stimulated pyrophosphate-energized sodium pump
LLAIKAPEVQVMLLVWIFAMRLVMILASAFSYWINAAIAKIRFANADEMDFEQPLITLVWLTSLVSIALTYIASWYLISSLGDGTMWWKLASIITCGTSAGALIPELVNRFTSTKSAHVRNVVQCSKEGGAPLNILAGLVAGNFSAYWMGLAIVGLMAGAYGLSTLVGTDARTDCRERTSNARSRQGHHACTVGLCFRSCRFWLFEHGTGNDCG